MTDTHYEHSRKDLVREFLPGIFAAALIIAAPIEYAFDIAIGAILFTCGVWAYAFYRARNDEKAKETLEAYFDSGVGKARTEAMERVPVGGILVMMLAVQIVIANSALSEAEAEALATLFTFGPVSVGIFTVLAAMIIGWMMWPLLGYLVERLWVAVQQEVRSR